MDFNRIADRPKGLIFCSASYLNRRWRATAERPSAGAQGETAAGRLLLDHNLSVLYDWLPFERGASYLLPEIVGRGVARRI